MKNFTKIAIATAAIAVATTSFAQPKPEAYVKHRKATFTLMGWYFGSMGPVAKGEKAFNKDELTKTTALVATLAKLPYDSFVVGTENVGGTEALPAVWSNNAKFKAVASAGDADGFKKQFGVVGGTCKACHDDFRKK